MRKILNGIVIFIILILMVNSVFAGEIADRENKKRETAFKEALDSYMQEFMKEDTPEEDRITSYEYSGFGWNEKEENGEKKIFATISFGTTPANLDNTTWYQYNNMCFAVFQIVDDEYVLERISRYPDNFDKFMKRFEEYKKNGSSKRNEENTEVKKFQAEIENSNSGLEIKRMSNIIFYICLAIFMVSIIIIFIRLKNRK